MGRVFKTYLDECATKIYGCSTCRAHVADADAVVSKAFQGRHGRAYLVEAAGVVNVTEGAVEERLLMTGLHHVSDISCCVCGSVLGWKYVQAFEEAQRYKVGKVIVERARVVKEGPGWKD
jgi:hypothetical protein